MAGPAAGKGSGMTVLILQHQHDDGPAWLAAWLHAQGVPFEVRNTEAGEPFPDRIDGWRALAVLGGEMGANDELPSLRRAEALIRQALAAGVPTLGHCLGGQLMARALGARIGPSPAPEIGWQRIEVAEAAEARAWFGAPGERTVFQWHYDAFELPPGATALAGSAACPQQAFTLGPPGTPGARHLAMQFHVELDEEKLQRWSLENDRRAAAVAGRPSVQDGAAMRAQAARHLAAQQRLADRIFAHWLGLTR
jgi:GMP synthase-like glutamine amidotransferase